MDTKRLRYKLEAAMSLLKRMQTAIEHHPKPGWYEDLLKGDIELFLEDTARFLNDDS